MLIIKHILKSYMTQKTKKIQLNILKFHRTDHSYRNFDIIFFFKIMNCQYCHKLMAKLRYAANLVMKTKITDTHHSVKNMFNYQCCKVNKI